MDVTIEAFDGQYFVVLRSGSYRGDPNYAKLTQSIAVDAGQNITGAYFFSTSDYITTYPYWNDWATISLVPDDDNFPEIVLAHKDVVDVSNYGSMGGWATFSYTFTSLDARSYKLVLFVSNYGDGLYPSYLAVDALKIGCSYVLGGDITDDCRVDFADLTSLAGEWLNTCDIPDWCNNCDINYSSVVDVGDFALMAADWLIDCCAVPDDPACVPN